MLDLLQTTPDILEEDIVNPSHLKGAAVRPNSSHFQGAQSQSTLDSDRLMRLKRGVQSLHNMNCRHFHIVEGQLRCCNLM